ncbi:hypothetical protein PCC7418_0177 [Halothece sp. PCC 7418]|uniref:DUF2470 domain-containing protein n=1 Tax=Halothece sp. (strain PCC 7418) TaxID=65093 RepID=UPI0002A06DFA|nr:DUF2470 domain-containing protein [Halothece sp. PCC 7418]AFZ42416.1 hypothetical protein PCC7418_0177 [Halothece sp. PCC 7418]
MSNHASQGAPLNEKLLAKISAHLNEDHLDDLLACARVMGGLTWAEQATVVSLDTTGINLDVSGCEKRQSLRLEFPTHVEGVLSLRRTLENMITESRAQLSWQAKQD